MHIDILIAGLPQLSQVLTRIGQVPNVISARRKR
jgi:(p)ppGpp synthase/HD superfamily hydrolase